MTSPYDVSRARPSRAGCQAPKPPSGGSASYGFCADRLGPTAVRATLAQEIESLSEGTVS